MSNRHEDNGHLKKRCEGVEESVCDKSFARQPMSTMFPLSGNPVPVHSKIEAALGVFAQLRTDVEGNFGLTEEDVAIYEEIAADRGKLRWKYNPNKLSAELMQAIERSGLHLEVVPAGTSSTEDDPSSRQG